MSGGGWRIVVDQRGEGRVCLAAAVSRELASTALVGAKRVVVRALLARGERSRRFHTVSWRGGGRTRRRARDLEGAQELWMFLGTTLEPRGKGLVGRE
jgi:hypothetical protein